MPRYFFHLRDHLGDVVDEEGLELADDAAARREGDESVREMFEHDMRYGIAVGGQRVDVVDSDGVIVAVCQIPSVVQ